LVSQICRILINHYFNLRCFLQGDTPRFSNLSQNKGKSLERPKVQKRPHVSNPISNQEYQIDENQILNDQILQQNFIMEMEQEAANQEEEAILQSITPNMMNSGIDLENELYGRDNDLDL